jgi:photosystem II stability/assembly factor-like uncharacterized protein
MPAGLGPRHGWRKSALVCMTVLVLPATSLLAAAKPVDAAQILCGGFGGGPAPVPGGGIAFPDAMHGWLVGIKASLDLCLQSSGAVVSTSDGGVTWKPQRVPALVHSLSGVSFVNDLDGWAVGGASIIATDNGGATWGLQAVLGGVQLANVDFVNTTDGWAVGLTCTHTGCAGVVLATTNGGLSWTPQTIPGGVFALYSVAFANPLDGWAVGSTDCGQALFCPGVVLATTNGGTSWSTQTMPSGALTLQGVTFATSTSGWAVGWGISCLTAPPCTGVIMATTDGGTSWHMQGIPSSVTPLSGVTFLSSTVAWAVGGATLLTTADGGTTWTPHPLPSGVFGRGVIVNSPSAGLVSNSPAPFQLPGPASINKTIDGGATWQAEQIPMVPAGLFDVASAGGSAGIATGQTCDAVGAGFTGFSTCSASIAATTGRLTWTAGTTPPSASNAYLDGVAFPTPTTGWAVGNCTFGGTCAPVILMTANAGATWSSQTVPGGVTDLNDVSFAGGSSGWSVGSDCSTSPCAAAILATIDAGTTWNTQSVPSGVADLTGVAAVNSTTAWAVGTDINFGSVILGTSNGGTTWTPETIPNATMTQLEDVSFANALDGWAVGQSCSMTACGGVILATADGGSTWSPQTQPTALAGKFATFYGVDFVNAMDGWAVGQDTTGAVILSTANGGSSWAVQTLPNQLSSISGVLLGVSFVDSSSGWAVGAVDDTSVILHTTNGGMNWTQQPIDSDVLQSPPISPRLRDAVHQSGAQNPKPRIPVATPARRRIGFR